MLEQDNLVGREINTKIQLDSIPNPNFAEIVQKISGCDSIQPR